MSTNKANKHIIVAQQGWVFIGTIVPCTTGKTRLEDASVIRVWGTTAGLGEIAIHGPTANTVLDYAGVVEIHNHAVLFDIECTYDD